MKNKCTTIFAFILASTLLFPIETHSYAASLGRSTGEGNLTTSPNVSGTLSNFPIDIEESFSAFDSLFSEELTEANLPSVLTIEEVQENNLVSRIKGAETDLNSLVFQKADGTMTLFYYNEPIKYLNEAGIQLDKSLEIATVQSGFRTKQNDVQVYFASNLQNGVTLCHDDLEISMTPVDVESSNGALSSDMKTVTYSSNESVEYRYNLTYNGIKEDIILYEQQDVNKFDFIVRTNGSKIIDNEGSIYVYLNDQVVGQFDDIVAFDANGVCCLGELTSTELVEKQEYLLSVTIPESFLLDDETKYPVDIDPSFNVVQSTTAKIIEDTSIFTQSTRYWGNMSYLLVGSFSVMFPTSSEDRGLCRSLVKFPGLENSDAFNVYYNSGRILSVKYNFCTTQNSGRCIIQAYRMTTDWTESSKYSTELWNGYNSSIISSVSVSTATDYPRNELDITKAVDYWQKNPSENYGIMLKARTESQYGASIGSIDNSTTPARLPYITVNYSAMPTVETAGIISGGVYQFTNEANSQAMSCNNGNLIMNTSNASNLNQRFKITYAGSGLYEIEPIGSRGYRVTGRPTQAIISAAASNDITQKWYIVPNGSTYRLYSYSSLGRSLLVHSNSICATAQTTVESDWNISHIGLDVPLYVQEKNNTCGAACVKMLLHYYGLTSLTETEIVNYTASLYPQSSSTYQNFHYLNKSINNYLNQNGISIQYTQYSYFVEDETQFMNSVKTNIQNSHPIMAMINASANSSIHNYLPYTSSAHYVIISGIYYDQSTNTQTIMINDPHYAYPNYYFIPASVLFSAIISSSTYVASVEM